MAQPEALFCETMPDDFEPNYLESERAWFADYYREEHFSTFGMRLRMRRDLDNAPEHSIGPNLGRVLSIGCGDGRFEQLAARSATSVVGIDISPDAISIANATASRHEADTSSTTTRRTAETAAQNRATLPRSQHRLNWRETGRAPSCTLVASRLSCRIQDFRSQTDL